MIKMADLLRISTAHAAQSTLSWDAASWHVSKDLGAYLDEINQKAAVEGFPIVKTAPLPACAQFLNVIESVFSGMARAIIHNSDYPSVEAAMEAIDRYFNERNEYFSTHPKEAGQKIWGKERVPSLFDRGPELQRSTVSISNLMNRARLSRALWRILGCGAVLLITLRGLEWAMSTR